MQSIAADHFEKNSNFNFLPNVIYSMTKGKEVTIYDIADKLKISGATVSRALKDDPSVTPKTKQKITDLAEELGYQVNHFARNLRNQQTNTIGVIIPRINSYFMSSVISGMEHVANEAGYNLIISQSEESATKENDNIKTMFNSRVDGLLVSLSYNTENLGSFESFFRKKIPVMFYDRVEAHPGSVSVLIDNKKKGYEATKHLIDQGCRRIVFITAMLKRNVYIERYEGFRQALSESDIAFNEDYVIINKLNREAGAQAAAQILKMDPLPDGVFVANDDCAVGCMIALKQEGISIPDQIAFVGFNNDPVSTVVEPNLTTVNYPGYEIGEVAARSLIDHLQGKSTLHSTDSIFLRSELIIRASSLKKNTNNPSKNESTDASSPEN